MSGWSLRHLCYVTPKSISACPNLPTPRDRPPPHTEKKKRGGRPGERKKKTSPRHRPATTSRKACITDKISAHASYLVQRAIPRRTARATRFAGALRLPRWNDQFTARSTQIAAREYQDSPLPKEAHKVAPSCSMCGPKILLHKITPDLPRLRRDAHDHSRHGRMSENSGSSERCLLAAGRGEGEHRSFRVARSRRIAS